MSTTTIAAAARSSVTCCGCAASRTRRGAMRADASRSTCSALHAQRLGAEDGLLIARSPHHRRRVMPATGANIPLGLYQHDFSLHPEHRADAGPAIGRTV